MVFENDLAKNEILWSHVYINLTFVFMCSYTEFSMDGVSVEEPEVGPLTVNLTVVRKGGTLGVMTLDWVAMLGGKCSDWKTAIVDSCTGV